MAKRRIQRSGLSIFLLILTIILMVIGGLFWFDYLGIINVKGPLAPILRLFKLEAPEQEITLDAEDPYLLDRDRIEKQWEAITNREEELDVRDQELEDRMLELEQWQASLEEKDTNLTDRENSLNDQISLYENKRENLQQNSAYLTGMPPEASVAILLEMDDQDVVDILRTTETLAQEAGTTSIVAYWLSLMPTARAADIQRKMSIRPED